MARQVGWEIEVENLFSPNNETNITYLLEILKKLKNGFTIDVNWKKRRKNIGWCVGWRLAASIHFRRRCIIARMTPKVFSPICHVCVCVWKHRGWYETEKNTSSRHWDTSNWKIYLRTSIELSLNLCCNSISWPIFGWPQFLLVYAQEYWKEIPTVSFVMTMTHGLTSRRTIFRFPIERSSIVIYSVVHSVPSAVTQSQITANENALSFCRLSEPFGLFRLQTFALLPSKDIP